MSTNRDYSKILLGEHPLAHRVLPVIGPTEPQDARRFGHTHLETLRDKVDLGARILVDEYVRRHTKFAPHIDELTDRVAAKLERQLASGTGEPPTGGIWSAAEDSAHDHVRLWAYIMTVIACIAQKLAKRDSNRRTLFDSEALVSASVTARVDLDAMLHDGFRKLKEHQRWLYVAMVTDRKPLATIAKDVGVPEQTLRGRWNVILKTLRDSLDGDAF